MMLKRVAVLVLFATCSLSLAGSLYPGTVWARGGPNTGVYDFVALSPDETKLACLNNSGIKIHDAATGKILQVIPPRNTGFAIFGASPRYLKWKNDGTVVYAEDGLGVSGFSPTTGLPVTGVLYNGTWGWDISTDGQVVAGGLGSSQFGWWNTSTGQMIHQRPGFWPRFSKDGGRIAFYDGNLADSTFRIVDVSTNFEWASVTGVSPSRYPEWHPNDTVVAFDRGWQGVSLKSMYSGVTSASSHISTGSGSMFTRFDPDMDRLACWQPNDGQIHFYDLPTEPLKFIDRMIAGRPGTFTWSNDSRYLFACKGTTEAAWSEFSAIRKYHVGPLVPVQELSDFDFGIVSSAISRDGSRIFLGSAGPIDAIGARSRLYAANGDLISMSFKNKQVSEARLMDGGSRVICQIAYDRIGIYSLGSPKPEFEFQVPGGYRAWDISEDDGLLVFCTTNGYIKGISLDTGQELWSIGGGSFSSPAVLMAQNEKAFYVFNFGASFRYSLPELTRIQVPGVSSTTRPVSMKTDPTVISCVGDRLIFTNMDTWVTHEHKSESPSHDLFSPFLPEDQSYVLTSGRPFNYVFRRHDGKVLTKFPNPLNEGAWGSARQFSIAGDSRTFSFGSGTVGGVAKANWGHVSGQLDLAGEPGKRHSATVQVLKDGAVVDEISKMYVDEHGRFGFCTTERGDLEFRILVPRWLSVRTSVSGMGDYGVEGLFLPMLGGDCDADNYVGTDDYLILSAAFDKGNGDPGYDSRAEFTGDGFIGTDDYIVLNEAFDQSGS